MAVPATIVAVSIPTASAVAWSTIICWAISVALTASACDVAVAAPAVARAWVQRFSIRSQALCMAKASRLRLTSTADSVRLPWPKLCSRW